MLIKEADWLRDVILSGGVYSSTAVVTAPFSLPEMQFSGRRRINALNADVREMLSLSLDSVKSAGPGLTSRRG